MLPCASVVFKNTFACFSDDDDDTFPLFKASIVNPAVGKGAGWIRSEILIIFLFFTSLIGLLRAEIN